MRTLLLLGALVPLALHMSSVAQDFDKVELKTTAVRGSVHAIFGRGGNIGVSAGEDGVFLIDDQFAPLSDKIKAEVAALEREISPDGLGIYQLNGPAAGQTVEHYHMHVIPRFEGQKRNVHGRAPADDENQKALAERLAAALE